MNKWREQSEAYVKELKTAENLWEFYRKKAAKPRFLITNVALLMNSLLMFTEVSVIINDHSENRAWHIVFVGLMIIIHLMGFRYAGRDIRFREETIIYALYLVHDEKATKYVAENEWQFEKFSES